MIVYFEGSFQPLQKVGIPLTDRGFLFGDGAYATIQVCEGIPLFLEMHLEKLRAQCTAFGLNMPPLDPSIVDALIAHNQAEQGIWRLKILVTGGDLPSLHLPKREGRLLLMLAPFNPPEKYPLVLGIFTMPLSLCHASYKSLAHLNRLYVMEEAKQQGVDDCITLSPEGFLLEASFGNLFWVKDRTFYTPSPELSLYFGVTIRLMVEIAQELGYKVVYCKQTLQEMPRDAICFRVNTMHEIWPIAQIGQQIFCSQPEVEEAFETAYQQKKRHCLSAAFST